MHGIFIGHWQLSFRLPGGFNQCVKGGLVILYFQAYSSTFAPVDRLAEIYDAGLARADFRELVVSTRPDCQL